MYPVSEPCLFASGFCLCSLPNFYCTYSPKYCVQYNFACEGFHEDYKVSSHIVAVVLWHTNDYINVRCPLPHAGEPSPLLDGPESRGSAGPRFPLCSSHGAPQFPGPFSASLTTETRCPLTGADGQHPAKWQWPSPRRWKTGALGGSWEMDCGVMDCVSVYGWLRIKVAIARGGGGGGGVKWTLRGWD